MKKTAMMMGIALMILTGCTQTGTKPVQKDYPQKAIELVAPAGAGSGYDLTLQIAAKCLRESQQIQVPLPISNKPGNGGGLALEYLNGKRGADDVLAVYSPPLCLVNLNGTTDLSYRDSTTPIARLITDYGCIAVHQDSPFQTINDILEALKEQPDSLIIGGTSSQWSMDHLQFLIIAQAGGVQALDKINYVGYQDGSAAVQLMGGKVHAISSGISDVAPLVESGDLRVLAITAKERVGTGVVREMPTCIEQGIDAEFYNWRGIFGPKDMPDYALKFWEEQLKQMTYTDAWRQACENYGWRMDYAGSEEFSVFLEEMNESYEQVLRQVLPRKGEIS